MTLTRRGFLGPAAAAAGAPLRAHQAEGGEAVLFPFDDHAFPFQHGVQLQLESYRQDVGRASNQVMGPGPAGAPDSNGVLYYGTVLQVEGEFRMWYLGHGDRDPERHLRICHAVSKDGRHWTKPRLGLVEYGGNRENNLIGLMDGRHYTGGCVVFHDPWESDERRRFKMAFETRHYRNNLAVAYSADGLRWTESPGNPRGPWLEPSGGTRFQGAYYLTGQGGKHWSVGHPGARKLVTHVSYDFENWTQATCLGLRRDPLPPRAPVYGWNAGEQIHLGAGLWNRGNVILGVYGQWHGHPSNDRRLVSMDLGLAVSNDALHYREPVPDFRMVEAMEIGYRLPPRLAALEQMPALMQGQGFANVGDETLFWYSPWPELKGDGVRVAVWPRDRIGSFRAFVGPQEGPHVVSAPFDFGGRPVAVRVNASGVGPHAQVRCAVLDEQFRALPDYSAEKCAPVEVGGFARTLRWGRRDTVSHRGPMRVRVEFSGPRCEDARLWAVYIG